MLPWFYGEELGRWGRVLLDWLTDWLRDGLIDRWMIDFIPRWEGRRQAVLSKNPFLHPSLVIIEMIFLADCSPAREEMLGGLWYQQFQKLESCHREQGEWQDEWYKRKGRGRRRKAVSKSELYLNLQWSLPLRHRCQRAASCEQAAVRREQQAPTWTLSSPSRPSGLASWELTVSSCVS